MVLKAEFVKHCASGVSVKAAFQMELGTFSMNVLFGPSGCGKTALLRVLAGIERPEKGLIAADGKIWFQGDGRQCMVSPEREVGYVLKGDALASNLSVASNITSGLRKWPTRARGKRVAELLARMGVPELAKGRPLDLSPLDQRRILLARAVAPRPKVLLLDEPFAGLDRVTAELFRRDLEDMLRAEGLAVLVITADRSDALRLGGRVMRMDQGRIVQDGRAAEVLLASTEKPRESGADCVVRARVAGRMEGMLRLDVAGALLYAADPGGSFEFANLHICSESVGIERPGPGLLGSRNSLQGRVRELVPEGSMTRIRLDCGFPLEALLANRACHDLHLRAGDPVVARVKTETLQVIPAEVPSIAAVRRNRALAMAI